MTVSGFLSSGDIFFRTTVVGSGSLVSMEWTYPENQMTTYNAWVERAAESFDGGDVSEPH